ncbi:hypothetical protein GQ42DRAFT_36941 [Ramicandelaber brevisporus]|nr:hypothetical protein GQ42DRAFT_36941 [Ramicandelaber brevisporus]
MSTPSSPLIHLYFSSTSSSTGVVPPFVPRCWRVLARCSVPVVVVPLPPGWCGWHSGFSQRHVPSVSLPSWFVPLPLAFLPHLLLAVVGHWLSSSEGGCVGCQHLFPRCCRHAMFFFPVRFGSVRY